MKITSCYNNFKYILSLANNELYVSKLQYEMR